MILVPWAPKSHATVVILPDPDTGPAICIPNAPVSLVVPDPPSHFQFCVRPGPRPIIASATPSFGPDQKITGTHFCRSDPLVAPAGSYREGEATRTAPHGVVRHVQSGFSHRSELAESRLVQPIALNVRSWRRLLSFIEHFTGLSVLRAPHDCK